MAEEEYFPKSAQEFAKDLIKIFRKHSIGKFNGKIDISSFYHHDCSSWGTFQFNWEHGRHGSKSGELQLVSEKRMNLKLKDCQVWPG